ncbi:MAG: pyrroline-5-carboxylate reductase [Verrucomicrobiota bacterium JB022]|nr:pyrroline-5-carboxylate reductase [Verrucomicrobiota bacterium JB022]
MAKIAFIGAGRMASAIVAGLLRHRVAAPEQIICTSAADNTGPELAEKTGIGYTESLDELFGDADTVVLACKPQQLGQLPDNVAELGRKRLIISILAGTPIAKLQSVFPTARNIVRAMPNTPGQIGAGITAYAASSELDHEDDQMVKSILDALGETVTVTEDQIDAVTGVSGSGPAYVFEFVAALRDAGVAAGLDAELSYRLALQTVRGAGELLNVVPETPETHRNWVSSPGGTTLAGLAVMEQAGFRELMKRTVLAAKHRAEELAQG